MPVMPVHPCYIERIAYAADTSAGKRKFFDRLQIVFDATAPGAQAPAAAHSSAATTGASTPPFEVEPLRFADPTLALHASIEKLTNASVREQARSVLRDLKPIVLVAAKNKDLPSLRAFEHEDGSASIEWAFSKKRLTFSFETDPRESGWFFVSSPEVGGVLASGALSGMQLKLLVDWAAM